MNRKRFTLEQWAREHLDDPLMESLQEIGASELHYSFSITSTNDGKVKMTCRGHISTNLTTRKATILTSSVILAGGMLFTSLIEQISALPTRISLLVTFFT